MKILLGFMFLCLMLGTVIKKEHARGYFWPVMAMAVLLAIGYFYFNQA